MSEEQLTPEQEQLAQEYVAKWLKISRKTLKDWDQAKAENAVNWIYKNLLNLNPPTIHTFDNPEDAVKAYDAKPQDVKAAMWFCNWWVGWVCFYNFRLEVLFPNEKVDKRELFNEFIQHWPYLHIIIPCEDTCGIIKYPETLELVEKTTNNLELHASSGPALKYAGSKKQIFALNGKQVEDWLVTVPSDQWTAAQRKRAATLIGNMLT